MDAVAYIETLFPSGSITTMAIKGKHVITEQFPDPYAAVTRLNRLNQNGYDAYVALAQYGSETKDSGSISRQDSNVRSSRILTTDADAGPTKPYATPEEARNAVEEALDQLGVSKPTLGMMSGHGCRHIWVFDTPLHPNAWRIEAQRLCDLLTGAGVHLDRQACTDIKRGVRLIGTNNYKTPDSPVKVSLFHTGQVLSLREYRSTVYTEDELSQQVSQEDLKAGMRPRENAPYRIGNIGDKCPVLAYALSTGGADDDEPAWMLKLQLLACAEDGREFIHEISKGHADYDHGDTEDKFQQRFNADGTTKAGPPLCSTLSGPQCGACYHQGRVTTPARLGRVVPAGLPPGYFSDASGTFRKGPDGEDPVFVSATQFLDASLSRLQSDGAGEHKGGQLVMRIHYLSAGLEKKEVILPVTTLSSTQSYQRILLAEGINATHAGPRDPMKQMLGSWLDHLHRTQKKEAIVEKVGWVEAKSGAPAGFALPDRVYRKGRAQVGEVPHIDAGVEQIYQVRGTLDNWRRGAQAVVDGGDAALAIPIAVGLGAPLMRFTNVSGSVVSLSSAVSGSGKTTALWAGAGIWGNPHKSLVLANDTANSVLGRIGRAPNMPVYWDEIFTQWHPEAARAMIDTIFRLAQGREKARMRSTREIMPGAQWETLVCTASNYRLMDAVRSVSHQSAANLARLIEARVGKVRRSRVEVDLLQNNYGHAGRIYAKWLSINAEAIAKKIPAHQHHIIKTYFSGDVQARFWAAAIACMDAGVRFGKLLGLVDINPQRLIKTLMGALEHQAQSHAKEQLLAPADILMHYLDENREHLASVVWTQRFDGATRSGVGTLSPMPGKPAHAIHYITGKTWQVKVRPLRQWLTKKSYNATEVLEELTFTPGCTVVTGLFGDRSQWQSGRVKYFDIDVTKPAFRDAGLHLLGKEE